MRIATNSILRNYKSNLNNSLSELNSARDKVMTKRNFNRISEDPAAALKSFQLRRDYLRNDDHMENIRDIQADFEAIEDSSMQVSKLATEANAQILEAINESTGLEQRKTIATSLRKIQESMVLSANASFGGKFLLGGANTKEVPFELKEGKLTFRGVDVDDPANADILKEFTSETLFADIGFGLQEDADGNLIENSAFNTAFSGIKLFGYGQNADGVKENVVTLLGDIATALEEPDLDQDKIKTMTDQFTKSRNSLIDNVTKIGTDSKFLETTLNRLDSNRISLNEKIVSVENVDLPEAITNYSWAQYAYNAALKIGTSILSPSFIDFMK